MLGDKHTELAETKSIFEESISPKSLCTVTRFIISPFIKILGLSGKLLSQKRISQDFSALKEIFQTLTQSIIRFRSIFRIKEISTRFLSTANRVVSSA